LIRSMEGDGSSETQELRLLKRVISNLEMAKE
jgi:hypothetical protein